MFSCLQTLLAHVGNLTYSFLLVPQANRSFFSDMWGPRPWVQTSFWRCSGTIVVGYSFAVAAVFDCFSCLSLPHTGLCSLLSSWGRQRCSQIGAWEWVCSLRIFTSGFVVGITQCALCTLLLCSEPSTRSRRASHSHSLCSSHPPQCLFCSHSGFPNLDGGVIS